MAVRDVPPETPELFDFFELNYRGLKACGEIVNAMNPLSVGQEALDEIAADKTGTTGHKHAIR